MRKWFGQVMSSIFLFAGVLWAVKAAVAQPGIDTTLMSFIGGGCMYTAVSAFVWSLKPPSPKSFRPTIPYRRDDL